MFTPNGRFNTCCTRSWPRVVDPLEGAAGEPLVDRAQGGAIATCRRGDGRDAARSLAGPQTRRRIARPVRRGRAGRLDWHRSASPTPGCVCVRVSVLASSAEKVRKGDGSWSGNEVPPSLRHPTSLKRGSTVRIYRRNCQCFDTISSAVRCRRRSPLPTGSPPGEDGFDVAPRDRLRSMPWAVAGLSSTRRICL